jgi:hypothetical protein
MFGTTQHPYLVFDNNTNLDDPYRWVCEDAKYNTDGSYAGSESHTDVDGNVERGEWLKIEVPHKLKVSYFEIAPYPIDGSQSWRNYAILGSNDDIKWYQIQKVSGLSNANGLTAGSVVPTGTYKNSAFKYFVFIWGNKAPDINQHVAMGELKLYGHRENDLVRLPDPTNVLKYPHIAMTGPAQRGYVASASTTYSLYEPWEAFNGVSDAGGNNYWSGANNLYSGTEPFNFTGSGDPYETSVSGTTYTGDWLQIELPHKIRVDHVLFDVVSTNRFPRQGVYAGSNDGSTWFELHTFSGLTTTNQETRVPSSGSFNGSSASNAYKYIRLIITHNNGGAYAGCDELKIFGTGVDSIPIQIGGGNIDKVANFRVYDKFVEEDQALEIWDAQKDEFGRAKSSMTLHKGRLGIGTTEPEGRLAVADEPHAPEKEFPPRAGGFDGDEWYIEGHGTFKACASNYHDSTDYYPGRAFTKSLVVNFGYASTSDYGLARWLGNNGLPNQSSSDPVGTFQGHQGDWLELELPYRIRVKSFQIQTRFSTNSPGDHPKNGFLYGSNNRENWTEITQFTNLIYTPSQLDGIGAHKAIWNVNSETGFKYLRLLTTQKGDGTDAWLMISELKYFGTREQGQSVLHDGQLTLTKNLNVPRIGPALDADDTPRRDRLVVEYNTSTNPTFEGAVRDTSGRGFDGTLVGSSYNATEKALVFDGTNDIIEADLGSRIFKNSSLHTTSLWVKMNEHSSDFKQFFSLGNGLGNPDGNLKHIQLYHSTNFGLRLSFTQHDYRLGEVVPVGQWVHVAYTYDGTTWQNTTTPTNVNIYINGTKVDITSVYQIGGGGGSALDLSIAKLGLGASTDFAQTSPSNSQLFTHCDISNFKLYDTALTASEVKTLYDMGRCDEGHHVVNFSKTRVGIGLGDGEAPRGALDVRGDLYLPSTTFPNYKFYDEGEFVPYFGAVNTPTYTEQFGRYTKIGNVVFVHIMITYSGLNTSDTSAVHVRNVPFQTDGTNTNCALVSYHGDYHSMFSPVNGAGARVDSDTLLLTHSSDGNYVNYNECNTSGSLNMVAQYFIP